MVTTTQPFRQAVTDLSPVVRRLAHGGTWRAAITMQHTVIGGGNHSETGYAAAHAGIQAELGKHVTRNNIWNNSGTGGSHAPH